MDFEKKMKHYFEHAFWQILVSYKLMLKKFKKKTHFKLNYQQTQKTFDIFLNFGHVPQKKLKIPYSYYWKPKKTVY